MRVCGEAHVGLIMDKQRQHEECNQQSVELMIAAMHATADQQQPLDMHDLMHRYFDQHTPNNTQLLLEQLKQQRTDAASKSGELRAAVLECVGCEHQQLAGE